MYEEYLKDKRVCLVGPAAQTEIMKIGKLIDSYDIVARVGHYNYLVPDEIGSRTDLIFENFYFWGENKGVHEKEQYDEWLAQGVKWFNHTWCDNKGFQLFEKINLGRVKIQIQPASRFKALRNRLESPTKGACAIDDLLYYPISELFIVGFSFYKGFGCRSDYFNNPFGNLTDINTYVDPKESVNNLSKWTVNPRTYDHRVDQELDWFKSITDKRIKCDEWLERIID